MSVKYHVGMWLVSSAQNWILVTDSHSNDSRKANVLAVVEIGVAVIDTITEMVSYTAS